MNDVLMTEATGETGEVISHLWKIARFGFHST
jgi:hypothetical protein